MKKILIILLMILSISLVACSDKYEKIYNLDNVIEIVEIFNEEQAREYLEECRRVLETIDYITYEGIFYYNSNHLNSNSDSITEYTTIRKGKFQRNEEIKFMFENYKTSTSEEGETKVVSDYKAYGKDGNLYRKFKDGEKSYIFKAYRLKNPMEYFADTLCETNLNMNYGSHRTYGIDENGNLISQFKGKWNNTQDSIFIEVYNNYKLVYREWRLVKDGQIVYLDKDAFSYNWFMPIVENFDDYERYYLPWE